MTTRGSAALVLSFAGLALAATRAAAEAPISPLDGKTFVGETGEKGKAASEKDEVTFKNGRFHSKGCDAWGFGDGPYRLTKVAGGIGFEATTTSAKEGKIQWKGTVKGEDLDGVFTWTKPGQAAIDYWIKARRRH